MENTKTLTPKQVSTFIITFFLICLHILNTFLSVALENSDLTKTPYRYYHLGFTFILLGILIFVNRDNLSEIHVDPLFYVIFTVTGILFSWLIWGSVLSLLTALTTATLFESFLRKKLNFGNIDSVKIATFSIIAVIAYALFGLMTLTTLKQVDLEKQIYIFSYSIILVSFWELVFRGAIWSLLKINDFSKGKFFTIQLLIFWFIFVLRPTYSISFFLLIPLLIGIWHSFLVNNSKSITPAVIAYSILTIMLQ